jgi:hypothetical protein
MKKLFLAVLSVFFSVAVLAQVDNTIDKGAGWVYFSGEPGTVVQECCYAETAINVLTGEAWIWDRVNDDWVRWYNFTQLDTVPTADPGTGPFATLDTSTGQWWWWNDTDGEWVNGAAVMTGATGATDGASGLVPQPVAGDENKYLKGDGTWGTLSGDIPTTIGSLDDVSISAPVNGQVMVWQDSLWVNQELNVDDADADSTNEIQQIDTLSFDGTILSGSLSGDGIPADTADLSSLEESQAVIDTATAIRGDMVRRIGQLNDVDTSGVSTGKILKFNGVTWAIADDDGSMGSDSLGDLADVVLTGPTAGEILYFNGFNWIADSLDIEDGDADPTNEIQDFDVATFVDSTNRLRLSLEGEVTTYSIDLSGLNDSIPLSDTAAVLRGLIPESFGDLGDVTFTSPLDSALVFYDSLNGVWIDGPTIDEIRSSITQAEVSFAEMFVTSADPDTLVITAGTPVILDGATAGDLQNFTFISSGRLVYTGTDSIQAQVVGSISLFCQSNGRTVSGQIYKNGSAITSTEFEFYLANSNEKKAVPITGIVALATNDTIDVRLDLSSSATIVAVDYNVNITSIGGGSGGGGGGSPLTVAEGDGSPSVSDVTQINFDQADGFSVVDDGSGVVTINFSGAGTDNQTIDTLQLSGDTLQISLSGDNEPLQTVDLSSLGGGSGTDTSGYNISLNLAGTVLQLTDGDGTLSQDLAALQDGTGTDDQTLTLSNDSLSIESGNTVVFSGWDTNASDDFSGSWNDLTNIPAGFADNTDNVGVDFTDSLSVFVTPTQLSDSLTTPNIEQVLASGNDAEGGFMEDIGRLTLRSASSGFIDFFLYGGNSNFIIYSDSNNDTLLQAGPLGLRINDNYTLTNTAPPSAAGDTSIQAWVSGDPLWLDKSVFGGSGGGSDDQTLAEVLTEGNSAGASDIDMNDNSVNNIDSYTINTTGDDWQIFANGPNLQWSQTGAGARLSLRGATGTDDARLGVGGLALPEWELDVKGVANADTFRVDGAYYFSTDPVVTSPGDTLVQVWTDSTTAFFIDKSEFGGVGGSADGDGIYDGSGALSGNTTVTMGGNTLDFSGDYVQMDSLRIGTGPFSEPSNFDYKLTIRDTLGGINNRATLAIINESTYQSGSAILLRDDVGGALSIQTFDDNFTGFLQSSAYFSSGGGRKLLFTSDGDLATGGSSNVEFSPGGFNEAPMLILNRSTGVDISSTTDFNSQNVNNVAQLSIDATTLDWLLDGDGTTLDFRRGGTDYMRLDASGGLTLTSGNLSLSNNDLNGVGNFRVGATTNTTNGSGDITVTHGHSGTPTAIQITVAGGGTPLIPVVGTVNSTTFTVRFYNTSGAAVTSTSVSFYWTAR